MGGQIEQVDRAVTDQEQVGACRSHRRSGPCSHPASPSPVGNVPASLQVVHKAVLDVGEEGTEGAAATGIKVGITSINEIPLSFNRPFLIAIVLKDTQSIIFLGKVTNPSQA